MKCECCKRANLKKGKRNIVTHNKWCCNYCYHNCEHLSGLPRCHIERKKIGGYWSNKRSNTFTKFDNTTEKRNQKEYFDIL